MYVLFVYKHQPYHHVITWQNLIMPKFPKDTIIQFSDYVLISYQIFMTWVDIMKCVYPYWWVAIRIDMIWIDIEMKIMYRNAHYYYKEKLLFESYIQPRTLGKSRLTNVLNMLIQKICMRFFYKSYYFVFHVLFVTQIKFMTKEKLV